MAGLDGIKNKIDPGPAMDKDLYDLPKEGLKQIPTVCGSLREALENLDQDRAFLKNGGVFDDDFIDSYIELKMTEVERFEMIPHRSNSTCTIRCDVRRDFPPTALPEKSA
jgi:glutamine synthetase